MKELLISALNHAINNYINKANRGYKMGLFSNWRHSFSKTTKLHQLEQDLLKSKNDEDALSIINESFLSTKATFNNHSFNNYFIDELKIAIPHIDWNCFTPKAIKKYVGPIYRGTSQPPEKIFEEGFIELSSSVAIEDYLKFKNDSTGVSTSKDFDCAKDYALNNKRSNRQRYIYVINYRGRDGFDVLETGKARGLSFHEILYRTRYSGWRKREVNVQGGIDNSDVVGAWKVLDSGELEWIDNRHYRLDDVVINMGEMAFGMNSNN